MPASCQPGGIQAKTKTEKTSECSPPSGTPWREDGHVDGPGGARRGSVSSSRGWGANEAESSGKYTERAQAPRTGLGPSRVGREGLLDQGRRESLLPVPEARGPSTPQGGVWPGAGTRLQTHRAAWEVKVRLHPPLVCRLSMATDHDGLARSGLRLPLTDMRIQTPMTCSCDGPRQVKSGEA